MAGCVAVAGGFWFLESAVAEPVAIDFHTDRPGYVSLNIHGARGTIASRLLAGEPLGAGDHHVQWDGGNAHGAYTWRAVFREDLKLDVVGSVGDFGGDLGPPSASAADGLGVYLGWTRTSADGDAVVACGTNGAVRWRHHRGAFSGCIGLAADGGYVYVLGGEGADAEGRTLYRLNAKDGSAAAWPDGRIDLPMSSLWPAKGKYKPDRADFLAARNGHIYLTFAEGQFIAILDGKSGAYLQTIVGTKPEVMDSVATKSNGDENSDKLIDADFLVIAMKRGEIGKLLLAHDPIWVLAGDATQLDPGQAVTAITMIGDGAPHHARDMFIALGPPMDQVEARSALDTDIVSYRAGEVGGHGAGPWMPQRLANVRGLSLDAAGHLWITEGGVPGRVTMWSTDLREGMLEHEFFAVPGGSIAINPVDPHVIAAGGREWRIDAASGRASCVGTGTGGDFPAVKAARERYRVEPDCYGAWRIFDSDGFDLGTVFNPLGATAQGPAYVTTEDGRLFIAAVRGRVWEMEVDGLSTVRPLASGTLVVP